MTQEGAKQLKIDGKDDMRHIKAVFGYSMLSDFLPPQLVYQGKTAKCLPSFQFSSNWSITYIANHWSNEETMELYITKIIMLYLADAKRKLKLPPSHPALLIFDNFKDSVATEKLLKLLNTNMVNVVLIPPNCTDRLQLLDFSVYKTAKEFLRKRFQKWYALQVVPSWKEKHQKNRLTLN